MDDFLHPGIASMVHCEQSFNGRLKIKYCQFSDEELAPGSSQPTMDFIFARDFYFTQSQKIVNALLPTLQYAYYEFISLWGVRSGFTAKSFNQTGGPSNKTKMQFFMRLVNQTKTNILKRPTNVVVTHV